MRSGTSSSHQSPSPSLTNNSTVAGAPPSTRKACDSCRLSKARCEPLTASEAAAFGSDVANICQRCAKTGRRCVFGERSRRQKRRRTGSGDDADADADGGEREKVSRLEKKVSILEARLGTASVTKSEDEDTGVSARAAPPLCVKC